jgi:hypothetical protein
MLAPFAVVRLETPLGDLVAQVRHSTANTTGMHVGLEFCHEVAWLNDGSWPEHCHDPLAAA